MTYHSNQSHLLQVECSMKSGGLKNLGGGGNRKVWIQCRLGIEFVSSKHKENLLHINFLFE